MKIAISKIVRHWITIAAVVALVVAMGGRWMTTPPAAAAPASSAPPSAPSSVPPKSPSSPTASAVPLASVVAVRADGEAVVKKSNRKELAGKLNLNTATEEQLMLLPSVGPSKAERIVVWRKKNGGFKRVADLRRVKGFGYRTFKRLEPFLDIKGDTTLAPK
jgi:competence ComEA-like helix-hairpin-helix protein